MHEGSADRCPGVNDVKVAEWSICLLVACVLLCACISCALQPGLLTILTPLTRCLVCAQNYIKKQGKCVLFIKLLSPIVSRILNTFLYMHKGQSALAVGEGKWSP